MYDNVDWGDLRMFNPDVDGCEKCGALTPYDRATRPAANTIESHYTCQNPACRHQWTTQWDRWLALKALEQDLETLRDVAVSKGGEHMCVG